MVSASIFPQIIDMSSPWKIVFEFVERTSHNSICEIESLFHAIPMVDIYINIEHSLKSLKQF